MNGHRAVSASKLRLFSVAHHTEIFEGACLRDPCAIKEGGKKLPGLKLKHITSNI
jgi:hypothetical protein